MNESTRQVVQQLSPAQRDAFDSRYEDKKKDPTTAFLLCLFTGGIGGHEFYLESGKGIIFLVGGILTGTIVTGIIAIIQLFSIQKRVKGDNDVIACKILQGIRDKQPIGLISAGNLTGVEADLSKLQELRDSGTISEDEFQQLRKKTLGLWLQNKKILHVLLFPSQEPDLFS